MRMLVAAMLLACGTVAIAQTPEPSAAANSTVNPPAATPASPSPVAYGKPISTDIKPAGIVTFKSEGRDIQAYQVEPVVAGPHPSVIVVSDIFGMTDWVKKRADLLAEQGYTVLVPNIYSRIPDTAHGVNAQQAYVDYAQTADQQVMTDISGAIDYLQADGKPTAGQPLAIVGYDMGGIYAMMIAGTDLRVTAAVNYYGRILYTTTSRNRPLSPVDDLFNLHAPLLNFYGTNDPQAPDDQITALESRLSHNPNGVYYDVVRYPGVGHGFLVPTRQGYNAQAAEQSEKRTRDFLAEWLRAAPRKEEE
ncbi:MAG TPA: dienelactone hydrolase family protein [Phycisphaerae bacterium]|nr:dienelactone hydrolase family protein [Phycisphaerae bacterium]